MNDKQIKKVADLCSKFQQGHMAQATGPNAANPSQLPQDWEAQVDNLVAQPGPVQSTAMPPWIWQLILQVLQSVLQNININPQPKPNLATGSGSNQP